MTQEALAFGAELSQGYINQLESGKKGFSQTKLQDIADELGVPLVALFEEEATEKTGHYVHEPRKEIKAGKAINKKEFWELFSKLPKSIGEHYMTLIKMELRILEEGNYHLD